MSSLNILTQNTYLLLRECTKDMLLYNNNYISVLSSLQLEFKRQCIRKFKNAKCSYDNKEYTIEYIIDGSFTLYVHIISVLDSNEKTVEFGRIKLTY